MLVSIFNDVLGPVMRGPSSSHCAAALRIEAGLVGEEAETEAVAVTLRGLAQSFEVGGFEDVDAGEGRKADVTGILRLGQKRDGFRPLDRKIRTTGASRAGAWGLCN